MIPQKAQPHKSVKIAEPYSSLGSLARLLHVAGLPQQSLDPSAQSISRPTHSRRQSIESKKPEQATFLGSLDAASFLHTPDESLIRLLLSLLDGHAGLRLLNGRVHDNVCASLLAEACA